MIASTVLEGCAGAPYEAGLLFLREGAALESAVRGLDVTPDVLMVNSTGLDHPRRAGLAVHIGAVLDIPTIGVTHRPLMAEGLWPGEGQAYISPLKLESETVGYWARTKPGTRPLAIHAGWRTTPETAAIVVLMAAGEHRTPEPLRVARSLARSLRAGETVAKE